MQVILFDFFDICIYGVYLLVADLSFEIRIFQKVINGAGEGGVVGVSDRADFTVTMSQWSSEHRAFAIEAFFMSDDSYVIARRQFCSHFDIRRISDGPSVNLIRSWVQRFRTTASAMNTPQPGPSRSSRTLGNIELVEEFT